MNKRQIQKLFSRKFLQNKKKREVEKFYAAYQAIKSEVSYVGLPDKQTFEYDGNIINPVNIHNYSVEYDFPFQGVIKGTKYRKSEMVFEERAFIASIITSSKPKNIVEIGVSAGGSSALILKSIKDMDCNLYSFDYFSDWYRDDNFQTGFLVDDICPELKYKWHLYTGGSPCTHLDKINNLSVDICLIDTVHFNPGEYVNFLEVFPYLKNNALVIFHDTNFHTLNSSLGITNRVALNSIPGRLIDLELSDRYDFPNISGVSINKDDESTISRFFAALSLPWHYDIQDRDLEDLICHFLKYFGAEYVDKFAYYAAYNNIIKSHKILISSGFSKSGT